MVMFAQFCEYGKNLKKQKERDLKKKSKIQSSSHCAFWGQKIHQAKVSKFQVTTIQSLRGKDS